MSSKKFIAFNSKPTSTTYPTLPEHITYFRLFLGLSYGLLLAFRENLQPSSSSSTTETSTFNAGAGLLFGLNIITFIPILYMNYYLNADTDSYKKGMGVTFVGVGNALAFMLLVWIVFFTMIHEEEEKILTQALVLGGPGSSSGSSGVGVVEEGVVDTTTIGDSEF